jgi:hypothetical protein
MKAYLFAASSLALAFAPAVADAQTVISRSISAAPVETTVTQTPTGTVVTRRPVQGEVIAAQPVMPAAPVIAPAPAMVEAVPNTVDAITTREVVRSAEAREFVTKPVAARRHVSHARSRHKATRKTAHATRQERITRSVSLSPRERHIVYQTIVERTVMPSRQVVVAPPIVRPPVLAADEEFATAAPITVGTVLPENVPLYAIPQNVALSVPAAQSYSYAWLGGRAYLVEPSSGMVVADVTE